MALSLLAISVVVAVEAGTISNRVEAEAPYDAPLLTEITGLTSTTVRDMAISADGSWRVLNVGGTQVFRSFNRASWTPVPYPVGVTYLLQTAILNDGTVYGTTTGAGFGYGATAFYKWDGSTWTAGAQFGQGCTGWPCDYSQLPIELVVSGSTIISVDSGGNKIFYSTDGGVSFAYGGSFGGVSYGTAYADGLVSAGVFVFQTTNNASSGTLGRWSLSSHSVLTTPATFLTDSRFVGRRLSVGADSSIWAVAPDLGLSAMRSLDSGATWTAEANQAMPRWAGIAYSTVLANANGTLTMQGSAPNGAGTSIFTTTFDPESPSSAGAWGAVHRDDVAVSGSPWMFTLQGENDPSHTYVERFITSGATIYSVGVGGATVLPASFAQTSDPLVVTYGSTYSPAVGANTSPDGSWALLHLQDSTPSSWWRAHDGGPWEAISKMPSASGVNMLDPSVATIDNDGTVWAATRTSNGWNQPMLLFAAYAGGPAWFGPRQVAACSPPSGSACQVTSIASLVTYEAGGFVAVSSNGNAYLSTNNAFSWTDTGSVGPMYESTEVFVSGGYINFWDNSGGFRRWSTGLLAPVATLSQPLVGGKVTVNPANPSVLWIVYQVSGGFSTYKSVDWGATWAADLTGEALPAGANVISAVSVDLSNRLHMYSSTSCLGSMVLVDVVRSLTGSGPSSVTLLAQQPDGASSVLAWGPEHTASAGPNVWVRYGTVSAGATHFASHVTSGGTAVAAGYGFDSYGPMAGNVNAATGNVTQIETDASVTALGPSLAINRTYNSLDQRVGVFGRGWSSFVDAKVTANCPANTATVIRADGRWEVHSFNGTAYSPPSGYASHLDAVAGGGWRLTDADGTVTTFNSSGRVTATTDSLGRVRTVSYDASSRPAVLADVGSGRAITLGYTGAGTVVTSASTSAVTSGGTTAPITWNYGYSGTSLSAVTAPVGGTQSYSYSNGKLSSIIDADSKVRFSAAYRIDGRVASISDGTGANSTVSYVSTTETTLTDPLNGTLAFNYDEQFRVTKVVDQAGKPTSYGYGTGNGYRSTITGPLGAASSQTVDAMGNPLTVTDGAGNSTAYTYDTYGNVLTVTDPRNAAWVTTSTWDGARHLKLTERSPGTPDQPGGIATSWTYTTGTESAYGSSGVVPAYLLATSTDGRGKVTTRSYDSAGNLTRIVDPAGLDRRYVYDQLGRLLTQTDVSDTYPTGVVVSTYTYNGNGDIVTSTGPAVTDTVAPSVVHRLRSTSSYDSRGRLAAQTWSDVGGSSSPSPSRSYAYTYDNADRLLTITDPGNQVVTYGYDASGNRTQVTDGRGNSIQYTYSSRNLPVSTIVKNYTDPANPGAPRDIVRSTNVYDDAGRAVSITDGNGNVVTLTYDGANRVMTKTLHDVEGTRDSTIGYGYDANGNTVSEVYAGTRSTARTFDSLNRVLTETFDMGATGDRATTFSYDAGGNIVRTTQSDGSTTNERRFGFDDAGRLTSTVVENGAIDLMSSRSYDQRGLVMSSTDANGFTSNYTYDSSGQLVASALPQVRVTDAVNDHVLLRPTTRTAYNAFGEPTTHVDANGNKQTSALDNLGRTTRVDYPAYTQPSTGTVLTPFETWTYDANDNLTAHTDRSGNNSSVVYDSLNRPAVATDPPVAPNPAGTVTFTYDDNDNLTARVNQTGARTVRTFDRFNRAITDTRVVRSPVLHNETTTYAYDDLGNILSVTDPMGYVTSMTYNPAGEVLTRTAPGASVTAMTYDLAGREMSRSDPLGRITASTYDLAGRPTTITHKNAAGVILTTETHSYDNVGRLTSVRSPLGSVAGNNAANYTITYNYDAAGRLTNATRPVNTASNISLEYRYDANGNQTKVIDGRGNATVATYNPWDLPESVVEPSTSSHPSAVDRTWTTTYNAAAQPVTHKGPNAMTTARQFDALGRMTSETLTATGQTAVAKSYGFDAANRMTSFSTPSGAASVSYDDAGRLTAVAGPIYTAISMAYDNNGRPTVRTDTSGTSNFTWTNRNTLATSTDPLSGATRSYTYFADDRPNTVTAAAGANTTVNSFTWDDLGRTSTDNVKVGTTTVSSVTYGYDADSNVTSKSTVLTGNTGAGLNTYTYDFARRLTGWTKGAATTTYGYDLASNRTSVTTSAGTATYVYDQRDRLVSSSGGGTAATTYTNNALGQRTSVATSGKGATTTTYAFDAAGRLVTGAGTSYTYDSLDRVVTAATNTFAYAGLGTDPVRAGAATLYAYDANGSLISTKTGTTARLIDTDSHGDITALYSTAGVLSSTATYDPFGTVTVSTGTLGPLGFQGDFTSGKDVWMAARWYQPSVASFSARDSVGGQPMNAISFNRYAYGWANPIGMSDPTGHSPDLLQVARDSATNAMFRAAHPASKPAVSAVANAPESAHNPMMPTYDELVAGLEDGSTEAMFSPGAPLQAMGTAIGAILVTADLILGFVPVVGDVLDGLAAATGRDLITGEQLSTTDRAMAGASAVVAGSALAITRAFRFFKSMNTGRKTLDHAIEQLSHADFTADTTRTFELAEQATTSPIRSTSNAEEFAEATVHGGRPITPPGISDATEATPLYRAVSEGERADLAAGNGFRAGPNSYEGKLFATTPEDAASFGRINYSLPGGEPFHIVETRVPTSALDSFEHLPMDGMPAVHVPESQLGVLGPPTIWDSVPWAPKGVR